jgi:hypothetical protein
VDVRLEVVEVEAELLVVLDVVGGLLSVIDLHIRQGITYLLGSFDDTVDGLVGDLLDELLEVSTGLLNLFVFVGDVGLLGSLLESILGLVGVLLE